MKAIVCDAFGPIDDLQYKDVADPVAEPGTLLLMLKRPASIFPMASLCKGYIKCSLISPLCLVTKWPVP